MTRFTSRRCLLSVAALLLLGATGCSEPKSPTPAPGGRAATEPASAAEPVTPSEAPDVVEVAVDMGPARVVAVALATGNHSGADVSQYLTGQAVAQAEQMIAAGREANDRTLERFGTVHHAVTLDSAEKAEYSQVNGVTMLTVVTFGWDAPPEETEVPQAAQARMRPGEPGTLAWLLTLDEATGLIDQVWTEAEVGDFD